MCGRQWQVRWRRHQVALAISQASNQVRVFFLRSSFRCRTCSPQQWSSARHLAFLMMISTGSMTEWMLSRYSFCSSPSISGLPSRQSTILAHLKAIHADTTSVFSCTTRPRSVSSWISSSHCVSADLFFSASRIVSASSPFSSTMRSRFLARGGRRARLGQSVLRAACCSSQGRLHSQQNSHWQRHFMCEQPTFFSMGWRHLGHSRVLLLIQLELACSELSSAYQRLTSSQATGQCGSLLQRKQQSSPQGQATVLSSIMLGLTQKQGHFSLGQQQMSLFCTAQLTQVFLRCSSPSSGATASTNPRSTGARSHPGTSMQLVKMRPDCSSSRRCPAQHRAQQPCGQKPVEKSRAWSRQTGHSPKGGGVSARCAQQGCARAREDQSSRKKSSPSFYWFHWYLWRRQRQRSSLGMLTMARTSAAFSSISAQSSSSFTNLASNCSPLGSYMLNSLVLLALEQVQRSCSSDSSEIFRLASSFGTSSSSARYSYCYIHKLSKIPHPTTTTPTARPFTTDPYQEIGVGAGCDCLHRQLELPHLKLVAAQLRGKVVNHLLCTYIRMITSALLQVEGLPCRLIEELSYCEREQRARGRFAGEVVKVSRDDKYASFIVSDGSASAEVTLVHRRISSPELLPARGDSVQIIGHGFRKVLGGKHEYSFLKILALSISKVSAEEELAINLEAARGLGERVQEVQGAVEKARPQRVHRAFESPAEQQEVRTLVMNYCYYIFENNPDLQTYIINAEVIRCSTYGREFMENFGTTRDCLEDALARTIGTLSAAGLLLERAGERGESMYLVKRDLFRGIEKSLEERIEEMGSKGGVRIDQLSAYANKRIAEYANVTFQLFNWKFVQKLLTRMQGENRIYKTSDKLIFPNSRY